MIRSKNKYRHTWVDNGKERGIELYVYTCVRCGKRKIKSDFVSASYYDEDNNYIGNKAPDCVAKH